ncbi:MAG: hypothetical protein DI628_00285 [Blastochloris viridis]|uniref:Uncharacterized protein n=1 Tax=Blastochloris viridis TaxID=1079 RepID=A0A6N4RDF9_BLAVI|nr:MAG: hypothetical protein DI628_00285 [Blastochloris viridis]
MRAIDIYATVLYDNKEVPIAVLVCESQKKGQVVPTDIDKLFDVNECSRVTSILEKFKPTGLPSKGYAQTMGF